jgi:hypothetical protein
MIVGTALTRLPSKRGPPILPALSILYHQARALMCLRQATGERLCFFLCALRVHAMLAHGVMHVCIWIPTLQVFIMKLGTHGLAGLHHGRQEI